MPDDYKNEELYENEDYEEEDSGRRKLRIFFIILAILLIIFGAVYTGYYLYNQYLAGLEEPTTTVVETTATTQTAKADNPINFNDLRKQNDEIYAWLKVPGTKVDHPVVQSKTDDAFYLKHDAYTKKWLARGAIYTEMCNSKDFSDRVTVIYGHNGYSDTMFTTLHRFEDGDFFDKHENFYIYMPKRKLTYKIVSAFKYDSRHLMNFFDFEDDRVFAEFLGMIQNPTTGVKNVRNNLDRELSLNDNIVVLSTCIRNQSSKRYLVCGVLVKDEETN